MNFIYVYIFFTSLTEPSILFQESCELPDRIFSFWITFIANKNNHFDIIVHVKFQFGSVPSQLLQIMASVLLLLDLFNSWEAYYPHSLKYTVISCYICSTQTIFCCQKISFLSPAYDVSWASVLEYYIKLKIIRILCTIPCSMGHVLYSQLPITYMYVTIDTIDQYWEFKKSISGIITWNDFIWNWLHSWKYHKLVLFYRHTILHTKCQYPPTHKCYNFS